MKQTVSVKCANLAKWLDIVFGKSSIFLVLKCGSTSVLEFFLYRFAGVRWGLEVPRLRWESS